MAKKFSLSRALGVKKPSLKRTLGVTKAKRAIAQATGIPTTARGRKEKFSLKRMAKLEPTIAKPEPTKKAGCLGVVLCLVAVTTCVITLAIYCIF